MSTPHEESGEPKRDFAKMFDLDRSTAVKDLVTRMESCLRDAQSAADDFKEVVAQAREREFPEQEIRAMKKIARLRLKDQLADAREQLAALARIGKAVQFDLFDFSEKPATH